MSAIPVHSGQLSIQDAMDMELLYGEDLYIFSTYLDEDDNKMPIEYESFEEALHHEERYGSVWIRFPDGAQMQLAPLHEEEYFKQQKA